MLEMLLKAQKQTSTERATLAHKYCLECHELMEQVKTDYPYWSWEYLWAAGCETHFPWLRAAAEPDYQDWLESQATTLAKNVALIRETIQGWERISKGATLLCEKKITAAQYKKTADKIRAEMGPIESVDPGDLPALLDKTAGNLVYLQTQLKLALWVPPEDWIP